MVWEGEVPAEVKNHGEGIDRRAQAAAAQQRLGPAASRPRSRNNSATSWESRAGQASIENRQCARRRRMRAWICCNSSGPFRRISLLVKVSQDRDARDARQGRLFDGHPQRRPHRLPG